MYKNEVKKPGKFLNILIKMFGDYGFEVLYAPDNNGDFEYCHYYILFGKKTYIGNEWSHYEV